MVKSYVGRKLEIPFLPFISGVPKIMQDWDLRPIASDESNHDEKIMNRSWDINFL